MNNDRYHNRKYSKCKNMLDLVNAFFGAAYKSFYLWRPIGGKVSVVSVSAKNVVSLHHYYQRTGHILLAKFR